MDLDEAARAFREFVAIIQALRTPETGCPWDLEQDHRTLRPYLIEEAHEVLDAIDRGHDGALREELGDLLLQVVLHAQVASDRSAFSITEVVRGIAEKMVRRHPHVFGGLQVSGADEVTRNWEQIKAAEAQGKGDKHATADVFARIPQGLPALLRAQRVADKAAKMQGQPTSAGDTLAAVRQGLTELEKHVDGTASDRGQVERELGHVLFALCQLASRLGVNAEDGLRHHTGRFADQFRSSNESSPPSPEHDA